MRPSKVIAKALSAGFHRMAQRVRPRPVGPGPPGGGQAVRPAVEQPARQPEVAHPGQLAQLGGQRVPTDLSRDGPGELLDPPLSQTNVCVRPAAVARTHRSPQLSHPHKSRNAVNTTQHPVQHGFGGVRRWHTTWAMHASAPPTKTRNSNSTRSPSPTA